MFCFVFLQSLFYRKFHNLSRLSFPILHNYQFFLISKLNLHSCKLYTFYNFFRHHREDLWLPLHLHWNGVISALPTTQHGRVFFFPDRTKTTPLSFNLSLTRRWITKLLIILLFYLFLQFFCLFRIQWCSKNTYTCFEELSCLWMLYCP